MSIPIPEQLSQLEIARSIVLDNSLLYPQIVDGILPIVGANARLELRRWGANFLAETFASPVVTAEAKQQMAITVLQTLSELLDAPGGQDITVLQGVIQASASIYGFIFKYVIDNQIDIPVWNHMAAIKSNILKRWDTAPIDVKVCCVKFVQKVVQVQTPGAIPDPRRPEQNETSIAIVPKDHPLIPPSRLEPEASGLLDRLLDVLQQDASDPVLVTATLNCLPILIRTRQAIANKILSAILNFNPLKRANSPITPTSKFQIRSMERTTRALLLNFLRRVEGSPLAPRIKQYVERMQQSRMEIFGEGGTARKRALPVEPTDGLDASKRRRMGAEVPTRPQGAPLNMKGPNTLAQVFTLTNDATLASFDVQQLPQQLAVSIANGLLAQVDQASLQHAVSTVRARLLSLEKAALPPALGDDDEDYEPAFAPSEDREQVLNRTDALPADEPPQPNLEIALGPFKLPQPPPLSHDEAVQVGRSAVTRVFGMINTANDPAVSKRRKQGLNRLAGSNYDRDAWITFITRLATRGSLETYSPPISSQATNSPNLSLSETIRDNLWKYIMEDFRARINTAIAWLNEEWFNDHMQLRSYEKFVPDKSSSAPSPPPNQYYEHWALKILEGIMPFLDAKDKLLIRFLSEIPEIGEKIIERVKSLARDPERVDLCVKALFYLVIMKPPARELCLNALEDLWRNYDDARAPAAKLLAKWRPHLFPPAQTPTSAPESKPAPLTTTERPASSVGIKSSDTDIKSPASTLPVAAAG